MREQLVDTFLLLLKNVVEALVHLVAILLDEALNSCLVKSLVERWVLCINIDLSIGELKTLDRLLIEDYVKWDLFTRLRN